MQVAIMHSPTWHLPDSCHPLMLSVMIIHKTKTYPTMPAMPASHASKTRDDKNQNNDSGCAHPNSQQNCSTPLLKSTSILYFSKENQFPHHHILAKKITFNFCNWVDFPLCFCDFLLFQVLQFDSYSLIFS